MRITFFFRVILLILLVIASAGRFLESASSQDYTFSLSPQLVELDLLPGEKTRFSISLVNESGAKKAHFKAYVADLGERNDGRYQVLRPGSSRYSAANWIKLSPAEFTLGPGKGEEVVAEVMVPWGVKGGRYAVIVFELLPEAGSGGEKLGSLILHHRMTTAVEISIKGKTAKKKAIISGMKVVTPREDRTLAQFGEEVMMFTASLKNEGDIHIFGQGTLTIRSKEGARIKQVPLGGGRGTVLPDTTVNFNSILRRLPPGDYIAEAVIEYDGVRPARAKLPFTVGPEDLSVAKAQSFRQIRELSLSIEPELIKLTAPPGALRRTGVVIHNKDEKAISVKTSVRALYYNRYGEVVLSASPITAYSCAEWVSISPSSFQLLPGERKRLSVLVNVPEGQVGAHYANLVFDAFPGENNPGTVQKTSSHLPLFLTIPGELNEQGRITETKVVPLDDTGRRKFIVLFRNTGNIHLRVDGKALVKRIVIKEEKGKNECVGDAVYENIEEIVFSGTAGVVLPGQVKELTAVCDRPLPNGEYLVESEVNYGDNKKAFGRLAFSVLPVEKKEEKEVTNIFEKIYKKCKNWLKTVL